MIFSKALVMIGMLGAANAAGMPMKLRRVDTKQEETANAGTEEHFDSHDSYVEHLDLEVNVNGERQLFPLLPGTKCPPGQKCRSRVQNSRFGGTTPFVGAIKDNMKTTLTATLDWNEFQNNMNTIVMSDNFCTRRQAMARAAGLAAGVAAVTVASPAYGAETKTVKMGADNGLLVFEPAKTTICKGDSVTWINNKSGPHNVVFDEDAIPAGVSQEAISQYDQMGEEDESFTMKFDSTGDYAFYCEPHRGAGMNGMLVVT